MLAQHRISGEWFDASPELAIAAVAGAAAKLGQSLTANVGGEKLGVVASAALAVIKFVAGIVLSLMAYASGYLVYLILTTKP
jgi:hypothetical protein